MGRIQLLNEQLINKIAAGEVVERPASVVKELVENSLDAGASRIVVELSEGGRKRILISDNGSGMDKNDAVLALQRHATSKISKDEDLFLLNTMGFRGEALASIASVSKFTLMTCEQGKTEGTRVSTDGGNDPTVCAWQSSGGTTIVVEDLFFNIPARAKFLKTAATEYGNILELMQSLALAWPHVDFTLVHNGKEQLRAPALERPTGREALESTLPEETILRQRWKQIFKTDADLPMIYASGENSYAEMRALISAPGVEKATPRDIYLFVNGRYVKDKTLRFAVLRGYHSHLLKGKYPVAALFVAVDPGLIDVNVHPNKTEVRLQFSSEIQGMIAMAMRDALRKAEWSGRGGSAYTESTLAEGGLRVAADAGSFDSDLASDLSSDLSPRSSSTSSSVASAASGVFASPPSKSSSYGARPSFNAGFSTPAVTTETGLGLSDHGRSFVGSLGSAFQAESQMVSSLPQTEEVIPWGELSYMGSIADCYLLFSHGSRREGARLLAVDQHAFHERILYERLCNNAEILQRSQSLLVPESLTFRAEEIESLKECEGLLQSNGFRVEFVDATTVELHAVPLLLARADAEMLLRAFIERNDRALPLETNAGLAHDLLATMACHAAVRAGEALGEGELKALLREASEVDFFHNCPHGRRVFRWWSEQQMGRWFDR